MMRLGEHESVVHAWAESCSGPGWSNRVVWVLIRDGDGKLRIDALQPEEQTELMLHAFDWSAMAHGRMTHAVEVAVPKKRKKAG